MTSSLTNAEKLELQRAAFRRGVRAFRGEWVEDNGIVQAALLAYPDPKEPTIVSKPDGAQFRINPATGELQSRMPEMEEGCPSKMEDWRDVGFNISDIFAFFEIAQEAQQGMEEQKC